VLLVDSWEGMRASRPYQQAELIEADAASVTADVTPIYRERFDATQVRRRSRLCADRFWLIEDRALFDSEHAVTPLVLRPEQVAPTGAWPSRPRGRAPAPAAAAGTDGADVTRIVGYPDAWTAESLRCDFVQTGRDCRCCGWHSRRLAGGGEDVARLADSGDRGEDLGPDEAARPRRIRTWSCR